MAKPKDRERDVDEIVRSLASRSRPRTLTPPETDRDSRKATLLSVVDRTWDALPWKARDVFLDVMVRVCESYSRQVSPRLRLVSGEQEESRGA